MHINHSIICIADILSETIARLSSAAKRFATYPKLDDIISCIECCEVHVTATGLLQSDVVRGPKKQLKKSNVHHQPLFNQGDIKCFHESNVKSSRDPHTNDCKHHYAGSAVLHTITTPSTHPGDLLVKHQSFAGGNCERDDHQDATPHLAHKTGLCNPNLFHNDLVGFNDGYSNSHHTQNPIPDCGMANFKTASMSTGQPLKRITPLNTEDTLMEMPKPQETVENSYKVTPCSDGYKKPSYVVLVGDRVRTCNTKLYASLPLRNKYMVKQRVQDSTGATRIKLVLKSSNERLAT